MSTADNLRALIQLHQRRLQKLKEQQARFGIHTPPHILTEIEDIEQEIERLRQELSSEEANGKPATPSVGSNRRIQARRKQLEALLEDLEAVVDRLNNETDPVNRSRLKRQLQSLEAEIDEVERHLRRLARRARTDRQPPPPRKVLRAAVKLITGPLAETLTASSRNDLRQQLLTIASKLPAYQFLNLELLETISPELILLTRNLKHLWEQYRYYANPNDLQQIREQAVVLGEYLLRIFRLPDGVAAEMELLLAEFNQLIHL